MLRAEREPPERALHCPHAGSVRHGEDDVALLDGIEPRSREELGQRALGEEDNTRIELASAYGETREWVLLEDDGESIWAHDPAKPDAKEARSAGGT